MIRIFLRRLALRKFEVAWTVTAVLAAVLTAVAPGRGTAEPVVTAGPLKASHLTVQLVSQQDAIVPGKELNIGLYFVLDRGWHVYWSNAGDSGEPPDVRWHLPDGVTAGPLQFPGPTRLPLGPLMDFGYENEVLLASQLQVPANLSSPTVNISGDIRWLVCREVCIPGKGTVALELPVRTSATPAPATVRLFTQASDRLPRSLADGSAHFAVSGDNILLAVQTGEREQGAQFFPLDQNQIANAAPQPVTEVADGVRITLQKDPNTKPLTTLRGVLVFADGRSVAFNATPGGVDAQKGSAGALFKIAGFALLGGALLNLMPCVFPVLFLKGLSLVQAGSEERHRVRLHGLVYTLGILVSFWTIVAVLLILRGAGQHLGWGFQFQSPTFVALMAMLLFFLALSLAGQFEIGLSLTSAGGSLAAKSGYAGSFFTGVLATVVATPCTAPFMGAAIGFALAQPPYVTFLIFTAIAVGLALPYFLLTLQPAWMRLLPRPGAWMEVLKQACAVPIFLTVIWLLWVFVRTAGADRLVSLLASLLILAIAGWALGRWPGKNPARLAALLLLIAAVAVPLASGRMGDARITWKPWTQAAVMDARAHGKPVFVDFTAAWCLSCQFNERSVLQSGAVEKKLQRMGAVSLRADWTSYDPAITATLAQLGRSGVPTYVVYSGSEADPPQVLPEALTQSIVLSALDQAASKRTTNQSLNSSPAATPPAPTPSQKE